MTDRFTEASKELQEKSAFVCVSCGHHNIPKAGKSESAVHAEEHKDHLTKPLMESAEKSAFVCESCGKPKAS